MKKASIFLTSMAAIALLFSCGSESSSDDMEQPGDTNPPIETTKSLSTQSTSVDFASKYITTNKDINITVTNNGTVNLSDLNIVSSESAFTASSSTTSIENGKNKIIKVTFSPTTANTYNGTLDFKDGDDVLLSINLTGTGTNKVFFTNDIKPLIQSKCSGCHTTGPNTKYNVYATASSGINSIINRINRDQGTTGFMPKGANKLSSAELALFQQWVTDGKLEN